MEQLKEEHKKIFEKHTYNIGIKEIIKVKELEKRLFFIIPELSKERKRVEKFIHFTESKMSTLTEANISLKRCQSCLVIYPSGKVSLYISQGKKYERIDY